MEAFHKWQIRYILKSGIHLFGVYRATESDPDKIAMKILKANDDTIHVTNGSGDNGRLFVRHDEIAAVLVVELEGK